MPKTTTHTMRTLRAALAGALLFAPLSAASPAVSDAEFAQTFAPFDAALPAPQVAGDVVDIATIEPAIEPEIPGTALGSGVASYYADRFHGRRTASGERFDMHAMTAAHRSLPFGSLVRVTNPATGASVVVRINDRGPFTRGRTIDLSRAAASEIGLIRRGHGTVELHLVES